MPDTEDGDAAAVLQKQISDMQKLMETQLQMMQLQLTERKQHTDNNTPTTFATYSHL